jgi:hypothetical protein
MYVADLTDEGLASYSSLAARESVLSRDGIETERCISSPIARTGGFHRWTGNAAAAVLSMEAEVASPSGAGPINCVDRRWARDSQLRRRLGSFGVVDL